MMRNENESSNSGLITITATIFMILTAVSGYVLFDTYYNKYQLSKSAFVCTKIEQVGKNLDDVICVQYTAQKHYQQAVSLNKSSITAASYMSNR
jgi:hypothetical protein